MTSTDSILAQIDNALGDWTVGPDAMRVRPAPEPRPAARATVWMAPVGTPWDAEGWEEIGHITDLEMTLDEATLDPAAISPQPAVAWDEVAEYIRRAQLERARHAQAVVEAFVQVLTTAVAPAVERAASSMSDAAEAFRHLPEAEGCNDCKPQPRRDRPAWQSPYGPAQRRRR